MSSRIRCASGIAGEKVKKTDSGGSDFVWEEKTCMALNLDHVVSFFETDDGQTEFQTINNRTIVLDISFSKARLLLNGYQQRDVAQKTKTSGSEALA